jgi:DNA-binding PadR family transcriptional regulator
MVQQASKKRWMQGASAPLRGALLGLLLERPGHGGELANRLVVRLGETWRIDPKDVYRLLEGLEKEGLATSQEEQRRGNQRGTRLVYHPTEQTPKALVCWMETLMPREPVRLGLQAKLAVAREQDVPRLLRALREYERECLVLAQLVLPTEDEPRSWPALRVDCTRDAVYGMLRADIAWANRTRQRIDEYAAHDS